MTAPDPFQQRSARESLALHAAQESGIGPAPKRVVRWRDCLLLAKPKPRVGSDPATAESIGGPSLLWREAPIARDLPQLRFRLERSASGPGVSPSPTGS